MACLLMKNWSAGAGSGRGTRSVESDETRNQTYEGSTGSGARSGATGATGGVTEGVRGLNLTETSGVSPSGFRSARSAST